MVSLVQLLECQRHHTWVALLLSTCWQANIHVPAPSAIIPKKKAAPAEAKSNATKSESATDNDMNGSTKDAPKGEEDDDEEAKLAARNSGKGSFDLEG